MRTPIGHSAMQGLEGSTSRMISCALRWHRARRDLDMCQFQTPSHLLWYRSRSKGCDDPSIAAPACCGMIRSAHRAAMVDHLPLQLPTSATFVLVVSWICLQVPARQGEARTRSRSSPTIMTFDKRPPKF
jgi:hypothetical protein